MPNNPILLYLLGSARHMYSADCRLIFLNTNVTYGYYVQYMLFQILKIEWKRHTTIEVYSKHHWSAGIQLNSYLYHWIDFCYHWIVLQLYWTVYYCSTESNCRLALQLYWIILPLRCVLQVATVYWIQLELHFVSKFNISRCCKDYRIIQIV